MVSQKTFFFKEKKSCVCWVADNNKTSWKNTVQDVICDLKPILDKNNKNHRKKYTIKPTERVRQHPRAFV